MAHLSRLAAPKTWHVKRKGIKWITRPSCGPHSLDKSMPLSVIMVDILRYASTRDECKKILNKNGLLVNKIIRKNLKFPIGLMDVLEFPQIKKHYRMLFDSKGRFKFVEIKKESSNLKYSKIINKVILKKGLIQLNLHGGNNIIINEDIYKVGDTIIFNLLDKKIKDHLKFNNGALIYLIDGKNVGISGILKEIIKSKNQQHDRIIVKTKNGEVETLKNYAFVIDKALII